MAERDFEDGYGDVDARALNQALVDGLRSRETLRSRRVESAFRAVPRHIFVPGVRLEEIYSDRALPVKVDEGSECVSSSSQPTIMATMLEQLGLEPGHKVLEIGAGSGYNAALMAHIVGETGQVITLDIDQDLVNAAREHLAAAGAHRVQVVCADGGYGYADAAPYDRIVLTVGAWDIAPAWWEQLKPGGRLVLPLSLPGGQKSIAFEREGDYLYSLSVRDCGFIRLRGAFADPHPGRTVQLGPAAGLEAWCGAQVPLDAEQSYAWLTGPHVDWETNVAVAVSEIIGGLGTWLAVHEPSMGRLVAWDERTADEIVPSLYGLGQARKVVFSSALFGESGLAALMRPPGQSAPLVDYCELFAAGPSFPLFVRQFGADQALAGRLVDQIQAWDDAGRPATGGLRVRAYRGEVACVPLGEDEVVIERRWTRFVLGWSKWPRSTARKTER